MVNDITKQILYHFVCTCIILSIMQLHFLYYLSFCLIDIGLHCTIQIMITGSAGCLMQSRHSNNALSSRTIHLPEA